jgi:hypothetical protein
MTTLLRAGLTIASLLVLSCDRRVPSSPAGPSVPDQASPPVSAKDAPVFILAFAAFKNDELVECDDLELSQPTKAGTDPKALADSLWASLKKPKNTGVVLTRLLRACGEQFSDRKPFAVCSYSALMKKDFPALHARTSHFSFPNIFRNDGMMRECLENGGSWSSIPRTSEEFREAQLRFDTLDAQKQIKSLMHHAE